MKKIFPLILVILLTGCNKYVQFTDWYVAFDTSKSSTLSINEAGDLIGTYYVHYCGITSSETVSVEFSVIPGNGLVENLDYEVINTDNVLKFLPGVYDLPIRIHWLPNVIDDMNNNTLTIKLESCDHDIGIGLPGPKKINSQITITKYKNF